MLWSQFFSLSIHINIFPPWPRSVTSFNDLDCQTQSATSFISSLCSFISLFISPFHHSLPPFDFSLPPFDHSLPLLDYSSPPLIHSSHDNGVDCGAPCGVIRHWSCCSLWRNTATNAATLVASFCGSDISGEKRYQNLASEMGMRPPKDLHDNDGQLIIRENAHHNREREREREREVYTSYGTLSLFLTILVNSVRVPQWISRYFCFFRGGAQLKKKYFLPKRASAIMENGCLCS